MVSYHLGCFNQQGKVTMIYNEISLNGLYLAIYTNEDGVQSFEIKKTDAIDDSLSLSLWNIHREKVVE